MACVFPPVQEETEARKGFNRCVCDRVQSRRSGQTIDYYDKDFIDFSKADPAISQQRKAAAILRPWHTLFALEKPP